MYDLCGRSGSILTDSSQGLSTSRRLLKISQIYVFPVLQLVECCVVDLDVDAVSGNLFSVLINYFEVAGVGTGVVVGFTVDVNCTGSMTAMYFDSIF